MSAKITEPAPKMSRSWQSIHSSLPVLIAVGMLYFAVACGEVLRWGGILGVHCAADIGWTLAALLAVAACVSAIVRLPSASRWCWTFIGAGCASWFLGQVAWDYFDLIASFPQSPTLADIGFLGFAPLTLTGMFLGRQASNRTRWLLALDLAILVVGVAVLVITLLWSDVSRYHLTDRAQATILCYPIFYGSLSAGLLLLPLRQLRPNLSFRLLCLGLLAETIPFLGWTPELLRDTFATGSALDILWMAGLLLIAAAALAADDLPGIDLEVYRHDRLALFPLGLAVVSSLLTLMRLHGLQHLDAQGELQVVTVGGVLALTAIRLGMTVCVMRKLVIEEQAMRQVAEKTGARLLTLIEASPLPITTIDRDERVREWSPAAERLLGWTRDEVIGRPPPLLSPDWRAEYQEVLARCFQGESVTNAELRHRTKGGRERVIEISTAPVRDDSGRITEAMAIYKDVTERKQAEEALRSSQQQIRNSFEQAVIGMTVIALDGYYLDVNPALCRMLGYSRDELLARPFTAITHRDDRERSVSTARALLDGKTRPYQLEKRYLHRDGAVVWALVSVSLVCDAENHPIHFVSQVQDITEQKRAEDALRAREASFRMLFAQSPQPMWVYDPDTLQFLEVNEAGTKHYGYTREEFLEMRISDIRVQEERATGWNSADTAHDALQRSVEQHRRKDGSQIDVELTSRLLVFHGRKGVLVLVQDVTERKRYEEQLRHQALRDALTSLPNRVLLQDRLEQAIHTGHRMASSFALLVLDLNRFKEVNDTLGHEIGDQLLCDVAGRLQAAIRRSDTVARLGGDEFALILPAIDAVRAMHIADLIEQELRHPLILDGHRIDITASIGIATYPFHGADAVTLLRHADLAMYTAKRAGKAHQVYVPDQDITTPRRLTLAADLRTAIDTNQLILHYQPKVHLRARCADHVEALVRWQHPEHGMIPPGEFIPLAEETGLIEPLTLKVLEMALHQVREWHESGLDIGVAVNLSVRNLQDPHLPETITWLLRRMNVKAESLMLEITESSLMSDPDRAMQVLQQLHALEIKISIDDFGTGYSSLSYLKQLPVDEIKIDRSFVSSLSQNGTVIVRSVIDLARNLGLQVTAEGVETAEVWDLLLSMGCTLAQGYYMSRPLEAEALTEWISAFYAASSQEAPGGETILLIEDNPVYQELLQVLLTGEGYRVQTAGDASEARTFLSTTVPDLIVTDVVLPGMSGLELVRQLRGDPRLAETVIVAMTTATRAEDEELAREVGCDAYLSKPNRNRDLIRIVRQQLASAVIDPNLPGRSREELA